MNTGDNKKQNKWENFKDNMILAIAGIVIIGLFIWWMSSALLTPSRNKYSTLSDVDKSNARTAYQIKQEIESRKSK